MRAQGCVCSLHARGERPRGYRCAQPKGLLSIKHFLEVVGATMHASERSSLNSKKATSSTVQARNRQFLLQTLTDGSNHQSQDAKQITRNLKQPPGYAAPLT